MAWKDKINSRKIDLRQFERELNKQHYRLGKSAPIYSEMEHKAIDHLIGEAVGNLFSPIEMTLTSDVNLTDLIYESFPITLRHIHDLGKQDKFWSEIGKLVHAFEFVNNVILPK